MKRTIFFFLCNCLILSLVAQNPNSKRISIEYIQYPNNPLQSNVKTYWSTFVSKSASYVVNVPYSGQIGGLQKSLSKNDSDLELKFMINAVSSSGRVEKSNFKKKITDSTSVTIEGGVYILEATMNFSTGVKDRRNNRDLILTEGQVASKVFKSSVYNSVSEANKAFQNSRRQQAKKLFDQILRESCQLFNLKIMDEFGYRKSKYNMAFVQGRGRKFDYSDLSSAFEDMKSANEILKKAFKDDKTKRYENLPDATVLSLTENLDNCIKIWGSAIQDYIPKKRKTRIGDKIIDHLYLNLSAAYFLKDNWSKASELLTKVTIHKSERKKAEDFKKLIDMTSWRRNKQSL